MCCMELRMDRNEKDTDGDVIERRETGTTTMTKPKKPSMWHCVMLNDDYTPMEFVVGLLQKVFHHTLEGATAIMLEVHTKGRGIAGTYTYEVAETKRGECLRYAEQSQYPLKVELAEA
jgi:ATP-dependent Clp protease adaptor protein ClpS